MSFNDPIDGTNAGGSGGSSGSTGGSTGGLGEGTTGGSTGGLGGTSGGSTPDGGGTYNPSAAGAPLTVILAVVPHPPRPELDELRSRIGRDLSGEAVRLLTAVAGLLAVAIRPCGPVRRSR